MNTPQENEDLLNKISYGLKLAIRKLYERKAANNEMAVISDGKNGIKWVYAKDVLAQQKLREQADKK